MNKKQKRLTKVERAILLIAGYMEDPNHDQYMVRNHVLDVLGYAPLPRPKMGKKK